MEEYLAMALWIVIIATETYLDYNKIEIKKEYQRHILRVIPRFAFGIAFLFWFIYLGYVWYWAALFLVGTHMLLFPEGLNKLRGKDWGYLGDINHTGMHKSMYDYLLQQVIKSPSARYAWLVFRVIFFLFVVGQMILQGKCTWEQLNSGGC